MFRHIKVHRNFLRIIKPVRFNSGYVVLLPEVPPNALVTSETNELLNPNEIPATFQISNEKCRDAISYLSLNFESQVCHVEEQLKDQNYSIHDNLMKDLDSSDVDYAVSLLNIVHLLHNVPLYDELLKRASQATNRKFSSKPIYYACKELLADNPRDGALAHHVLMGKANGMELTTLQSKEHLSKLNNELMTKRNRFKQNVMTANAKFRHLVVDEKHLGNMAASEMTAIAKDRSNPKRGPWTITLNKQVYNSFLENCPIPALRWNLWQAYNQRCTQDKVNSILIEEIRESRRRIAKLLDYRNHTEYVLESRLAGSTHNVKSMIATLLVPCKAQQNSEMERLHAFASSRGYDVKLKPWDVPFWRKQEREQLYDLQDLTFPFDQTLKSLLSFTSKLFDIHYEEVSENQYNVVRRSGKSEKLIGRFVVDPYKSKTKFPGSYVIKNKLFSTLILNFDPPLYGKESSLTPADVNSLFQNFGLLLQNCLTQTQGEPIVQDFRLLGHFLSMWLGNKHFVENFLSHSLKGDRVNNYLAARKHFAATDLCYELYLSDLDLELDLSEDFWFDLVKKVWSTYNVVELDKNQHLCSSDLIQYGSTYYSDTWSKMLAADCYRAFVESKEPKDTAHEGERFRTSFFEAPRNSSHPSETFRSFRGRDPSPDALLWSLGLIKLDKVDNVKK